MVVEAVSRLRSLQRMFGTSPFACIPSCGPPPAFALIPTRGASRDIPMGSPTTGN
ncbi:unnamed protein product [Durusdinium trenchii]|uniref:Uncharacterized protein n=1 Tax=Durusdinium trenchii TaxID=1381693 RepID=A0ABP0IDK7_9DINO